MFKKRPEVVLLVYGKGGHAAQMERFLNNQKSEYKERKFITLSNAVLDIPSIVEPFFCIDARDKHYWYKNFFVFFAYIFLSIIQMFRIVFKYKVVGMISTGPGLAVIPGLICRLLRKKVIFFEDWCRFATPSLAGRIMYPIANVFFVQHESIRKFYPKSIYMGRL